jgi:hypothetical protein
MSIQFDHRGLLYRSVKPCGRRATLTFSDCPGGVHVKMSLRFSVQIPFDICSAGKSSGDFAYNTSVLRSRVINFVLVHDDGLM